MGIPPQHGDAKLAFLLPLSQPVWAGEGGSSTRPRNWVWCGEQAKIGVHIRAEFLTLLPATKPSNYRNTDFVGKESKSLCSQKH